MKNETGFYLLRHRHSYMNEKDIHSNDASILSSLKAECKSCLSCAHAKSQSKNSLLRCSHKGKYVNHYNICIQHKTIQFTQDESSKESSNV